MVKWHPFQSVTRPPEKHHPVFADIGDGWMWTADHYSTRVWWIHTSGLHLQAPPFDDLRFPQALHKPLADAIRAALASGMTGLCVWSVTKSGGIDLRKWEAL